MKGKALRRIGSIALVFVMLFTNMMAPLAHVTSEPDEINSYYEVVDYDPYDVLDDLLPVDTGDDESDEPLYELDVTSDDSAEYVTSSDAGDLEGYEVEEIPLTEISTGDFILDPVIESHIVNNYDEGLTELQQMHLVGALPVRSTIFDGQSLRGNFTMASLIDEPDIWFDAFLSMSLGLVPIYELSDNSDYFVAFADTQLVDNSVTVIDYVFALNNLDGQVRTGHFDIETGIAYIPKDLFFDGDTLYFDNMQLQLMQVTNEATEIYSNVAILIDDDLTSDDDVQYVSTQPSNRFETVTTIETGLDANDVNVRINGFETNNFSYDAETGEVTVYQDSASIISLRVTAEDGISELSGYQPIQPTNIGNNHTIADVILNQTLINNGFMDFTVNARYYHPGSTHATRPQALFPNTSHVWWLNEAEISRLVDEIMNGGVNANNIQSSNGHPLSLMAITLDIRQSTPNRPSPFTSISNVRAPFDVGVANSVRLPLICAHVGVRQNPSGTMTGTNNLSTGDLLTRARVIRQTSDYVIVGMVTANTGIGQAGGVSQAGYGVVRFNLEPQDGYARVQKVSAGHADYVAGNPHFSLENAVYWVFDSESVAHQANNTLNAGNTPSTSNRVGILTTNAQGLSNAVRLEAGTYWAVEITPSRGHARDRTVHNLTVRAGETTTFTSTQPVPSDPPFMRLQKIDAETGQPVPQGDASFAGIQYTVQWFANTNATGTPRRTWVFETDVNGELWFGDDTFLVAELSDPVWRHHVSGEIRWPLGTVAVQETHAPEGYLIDPTIHVGHIEQNPLIPEEATFRWADGTTGGLMIYHEGMVHENEVIRGGDKHGY